MTKLLYRGVEYSDDQRGTKTLAEQMRRSELVYRGVAHDGERATVQTAPSVSLFYRGHRYA